MAVSGPLGTCQNLGNIRRASWEDPQKVGNFPGMPGPRARPQKNHGRTQPAEPKIGRKVANFRGAAGSPGPTTKRPWEPTPPSGPKPAEKLPKFRRLPADSRIPKNTMKGGRATGIWSVKNRRKVGKISGDPAPGGQLQKNQGSKNGLEGGKKGGDELKNGTGEKNQERRRPGKASGPADENQGRLNLKKTALRL